MALHSLDNPNCCESHDSTRLPSYTTNNVISLNRRITIKNLIDSCTRTYIVKILHQ